MRRTRALIILLKAAATRDLIRRCNLLTDALSCKPNSTAREGERVSDLFLKKISFLVLHAIAGTKCSPVIDTSC